MPILFLAFAIIGVAAHAGEHDQARIIVGITTRIPSLDPFNLTGIENYEVTNNVLEPLARVHPRTRELIPCLAESWSLDAYHKTFRVHLRPGLKFSDGQRLTAEDVKFTFDAYRRPEYQAAQWLPTWEGIDSARVIDARTIDFTMKEPRYLAFENTLTMLRVLPRSFYGTPNKAKFRESMVGSGPFRVERFKPNQFLDLVPNREWWGGRKPKFALHVKTVVDPHLAAELMAKGELDVYAVPANADVERLPAKFMYRSSAAVGQGIWLDLNLRRPLFQSQSVRRALLLLWDRTKTNAKLYHGGFHLALDVFSPKMPYYPPGRAESYDEKRAREILSAAGWRDENRDGTLERDGKDFRFTVMVNDSASERWVSLYQADAAKIGVRVDIRRAEEDSLWWQLLKDGKFDAIAGGGGVSERAHASTWLSNGPYNYDGYKSAEVDRLLTQLESEFDLKKRHTLERRLIERIRADYAPVPGLYSPDQSTLLSPRMTVDHDFPDQAWLWRLKL